MASRQVVQHRNAEEAVAPAANKPKKMAAERKNRRALGDIGNIVPVEGAGAKPIPGISRPITRSYGAQLLANAKAAAAQSQTNKNTNEAIAVVPEKRAVARKPTQKKIASSKPKPEEIIEDSPDSNEVAEKNKIVCKEIKLKKNDRTLSSTLTARSKAASGQRKEKIINIDAEDMDNDLAVVEYIDEIYKFYKSVENEGRARDYMDSQPEINERMRAILIDWLIQVHEKFELSLETLYLTINIIDRFLALKTISRKELQLLGMSSMLIASKYEEIWAPQVNDLVCISDRACTNEQVLVMEKRILAQLEWNLTVPTPYVFLVRFIKASMTGSKVENMVYFLAELGMINYETIMYCPSMIAASAVYAARCTFNTAPLWNATLKVHTGFSEPQLIDCAKMLVECHSMAGDDPKLKGVYGKYSSPERGAVALLPPAKSLLDD